MKFIESATVRAPIPSGSISIAAERKHIHIRILSAVPWGKDE
jgi:hypothetical protein